MPSERWIVEMRDYVERRGGEFWIDDEGFAEALAALLTAAVEEERERVRKIIDVRVKFWAEQVRIQHDAQATDCHNEVRHLRAAIRARSES